jgi:hypothetical protein
MTKSSTTYCIRQGVSCAHDNVKGKPGQNQPASSTCAPEQKNAGHDSDYADERDGEHPPIERTFPEMTGRTGDLCDNEQPTENCDRKGSSSRTLKTLL